MVEKKEQNTEFEIDIQQLFAAVWQKKWLIIAVAVVSAAIMLAGTVLFVTPVYEASAMFYVNNSAFSVGDAAISIDSGDISASKSLVNSYIVILRTRESLNDVIDYADVDRTYGELRGMISASAVNSTEIFQVVVASPDPQEAERIADAIAYILPKRISSIIEGTSAKVVDHAVLPARPSSPSYTMNTLVGFLAGFLLTAAAVVLNKLFDVTIRSEDDILQVSKHPVLASVPDMTAPSKGGYYTYGKTEKKPQDPLQKKDALIGGGISFAAAEAYKLLRTKLEYSFAGEKTCRILGVTSALTGEGKSLTSVNLAYSLAQLGKRVLLVDCDMRRPSISTKLHIVKEPGLSGYLAGQHKVENMIRVYGFPQEETAFHVVTSGKNPPNPVELLSSARMAKMLNQLRATYDYILLDLPPIDEVSDALAVAKETDGILMVVRRDHCNRVVLGESIRQFEFIGCRILGITYNCVAEETGGYGKKYYKKYHKRYYSHPDARGGKG